jgi:hypothetical protein
MWSKDILDNALTEIFADSDEKLKHYFNLYIREVLRQKWQSELSQFTNVVHFRDYVEDILKNTNTSKLVSAIKSTPDKEKRLEYCLAFLHEETLKEQFLDTNEFMSFAIQKELDSFYELAKSIIRFRPVLKNKREQLESLLAAMPKEPSLQEFQKYAKDLKHANIWPVLALYDSHMKGESEELFLHCPMPRIYGSPSVIRNSIDRSTHASKLVKKSERLDISNVVVGSSKFLCYKTDSGFTKFAASASLIASLPGISGLIWTVDPDTRHAHIYSCEQLGPKNILEFDLQGTERINWIDCQRDIDNALIFSWGHINSLTGSIQENNCFALDDSFVTSNDVSFKSEFSQVPSRSVLNSKIDYRDHGNLMSVHHTVNDDDTKDSRTWIHTYDICFGNYLVMTQSTDSRPVEAIFGSAHDFFLLSPLSATQNVQQWTFDQSKYTLSKTLSVPKGDWSSICCVYK